jgi:molybdenum cofactor cytidylyltransferase
MLSIVCTSHGDSVPRVAIAILAAGCSSRLGQPKQLLDFDGKSLLARCIEAGAGSHCCETIVILGAYEDQIRASIAAFSGRIIFNKNWQEGIASSIRAAVQAVTACAALPDALILTPCDQPFVSSELINQLIRKYEESEKLIVACSYAGTIGAPALFSKACFAELNSLSGDSGAKRIIGSNSDRLAVIDFPAGQVDIDTPKDYTSLHSQSAN